MQPFVLSPSEFISHLQKKNDKDAINNNNNNNNNETKQEPSTGEPNDPALVQIKLADTPHILRMWNDSDKRHPLISAIQSSLSFPTTLNSIIECPSTSPPSTSPSSPSPPPSSDSASSLLSRTTNKITYWVDTWVINNSPEFLKGVQALGNLALEIFDISSDTTETNSNSNSNSNSNNNSNSNSNSNPNSNTKKQVDYSLFIGPKGSITVPHYDVGDNFIFVLQGRKQVVAENEAVEMKAGDLLYIPKFVKHSVENLSDCVSISFTVHTIIEHSPVYKVIPLRFASSSPVELYLEILLSSLSLRELTKVGSVCKDWYVTSSNNQIWKKWVPSEMIPENHIQHKFYIKNLYFESLYKLYSAIIDSKPRKKLDILYDSKAISKPFLISVLLHPCKPMRHPARIIVGVMSTFAWDKNFGDVFCKMLPEIDFRNMFIVNALRLLLSILQLPGEAPQIDRIMENFSQAYHAQNPSKFAQSEVIYLLSFAIIMLGTSYHNTHVKNKMTKEEFIKTCSFPEFNLPDELLGQVFDDVTRRGLYENFLSGREMVFEQPIQIQEGFFSGWSNKWAAVDTEGCFFVANKLADLSAVRQFSLRDSDLTAVVVKKGFEINLTLRRHAAIQGHIKKKTEKTNFRFGNKAAFDSFVNILNKFSVVVTMK